MISRERLLLGIGSGLPASIDRAALVVGDAPAFRNCLRTMPCICYARLPARGLQAVDNLYRRQPSAKRIGNLRPRAAGRAHNQDSQTSSLEYGARLAL